MFDKNNKLGDRMSSRDVPAFKNSLEWTTNTPEGGLMVRQLPNVLKCFCWQHPLPEAPPYVHRHSGGDPVNSVLISGVGRSASTVTWQILDLLTSGRVLKSHSFMDCCPTMFKFKKIIITIRHPFDHVFSVKKTHRHDGHGRKEFLNVALKEWQDVAKFLLLKNLQNSIGYRPDMEIAFLKYEDFWNKDLERINFLSNFIGVELNSQQAEKILSETSIEKNFERSQKAILAEKMGCELVLDNKIGPRHVDNTKGKIGLGKELDQFTKQDILDSCEWAFDEFGYSKDF